MHVKRFAAAVSMVAMLAGCGGGSGGSGSAGVVATSPTPSPSPSPTATPTPTAAGCSLLDRQQWAFNQLQTNYLFYDTLPASLDPAPYKTVEDYIDALTATARAQGKDRYFTYLTSIAEENAYYSSGSSAGIGARLGFDSGAGRLFIIEAFENAPALAAGLDRGTEILGIGTTASNVQSVSDLLASGGTDALNDALGPSTSGTTRYFKVNDAKGVRTVAVTKTDFDLDPVSDRYGGKILNDAGGQYGYINLRTFITPAESQLKSIVAGFKAAGINKLVIDFRYNGGGLLSTAQVMGNLLAGNRSSSDVFYYLTFRPSLASNNETHTFSPDPSAVSPTKLAFIGSSGTASASELVINAFTPYLHANSALIGSNTYGKPVGQIAVDRTECDDRLRVIAFALENANHQGAYYNGLAGYTEASCQAPDDISHQLGDPAEGSTRAALDFLEGKSCTPITASAQAAMAVSNRRLPLRPANPTTAQRETPGLY